MSCTEAAFCNAFSATAPLAARLCARNAPALRTVRMVHSATVGSGNRRRAPTTYFSAAAISGPAPSYLLLPCVRIRIPRIDARRPCFWTIVRIETAGIVRIGRARQVFLTSGVSVGWRWFGAGFHPLDDEVKCCGTLRRGKLAVTYLETGTPLFDKKLN